MQNFPDTFETRKRSFISAFSICMTVPLKFQNGFSLKQPKSKISLPQVFCKNAVLQKCCSEKFPKFHRKTPVCGSLIVKLQIVGL